MSATPAVQLRRALLEKEMREDFQAALDAARLALPDFMEYPYFDLAIRCIWKDGGRDESLSAWRQSVPALFRQWLQQSGWLVEKLDVEGEIERTGIEAVAQLLVGILRGRTRRQQLIEEMAQ